MEVEHALHLSDIPEETLMYEEFSDDHTNQVKKDVEFEQLSSKSLQKILSFLDFHSLLNCRAVSKSLKSSVDKLVESNKKDPINERWNPYYSSRKNVDHDLNEEKVLGLIRLQSAAAVKQFLEKNGVKFPSEKPKKVVIKEPSKPVLPPSPPPPKKLTTATQLTQTPPLPIPLPVAYSVTEGKPQRPIKPAVQQGQLEKKSNPPIDNSTTNTNTSNKVSNDSAKSRPSTAPPNNNHTSSSSSSRYPLHTPHHFKCEACLIPVVKAVSVAQPPVKPVPTKTNVAPSSPNLKPTNSILVKQPTPPTKNASPSKPSLKLNSKVSVVSPPSQQVNKVQFSAPPPPKQENKPVPPPQVNKSQKALVPPQFNKSQKTLAPPPPQVNKSQKAFPQFNKSQKTLEPPPPQVNKSQKVLAPPPPQVNKSQKTLPPAPKAQSSQQVNRVQPPQQSDKPPPLSAPPQIKKTPSSQVQQPPKPPQTRPIIVIPSISPPSTPKPVTELTENPFPLGSVHISRYIPENLDEDITKDEQDLSTSSQKPEADTNQKIVLRTTLLVKNFGKNITSFTFDTGKREQSDLSFDQLREILNHLPNLIFLSITSGNYEHHVDYEYTDDDGGEEIEKFPKLPHLRYITLGYNTTYHLHMDILNAYGCQLRRFTCSKYGYFVRSPFGYHVSTNNSLFKLIDYVNSIRTLYPTVLSKLEELKLPVVSSQCLMREIEPIVASGTIRLPIQWPHLKRLSLYYIHRGDGFNDCCLSDLWSAIGITSPNLEELCLDFQACSDFTEWISSDQRPLTAEVYQPCKKMKNLYISAISLLRADDMAGLVAPKFPNLENITFFNWSLYYEEAIHANNRQGRYYGGGPTPATIPGYIGYFWKELPVLQLVCVKTETWKDEYVYRKSRNELLFVEQKEGVYIY